MLQASLTNTNLLHTIRFVTVVEHEPTQDRSPPEAMRIHLESASEVEELLNTQLPGTCRVSVRLTGLVDTQDLARLVQLLRQKSVQLDHLSLNLSPTVEAPTLIELLKEVEAHHARQALRGLELALGGSHGGPIAESLREAIAAFPVCLTLGGASLRSLLFAPLLLTLEGDPGPTPTRELKTFIKHGLNQDYPDYQLGCLAAMALGVQDAALMRAVSALSPANTIHLFQLLEPHEDQWLDELQIPYRLGASPNSEEDAQALAAWFERPHPTLWALDMFRNASMSASCWTQLMQGLVAQPSLCVVMVTLAYSETADALPENFNSSFRLHSLLVCVEEDSTPPEAVALLVHGLKPESLALQAKPETMKAMLASLSEKSPNLFGLRDMHLGWDIYSKSDQPGQVLESLFKEANKADFVCDNHAEPRTEQAWNGLAQQVVAGCLRFSMEPGPGFGMKDIDRPSTTLRFVAVRNAYRVGAGEAVVQHLLVRHDRFGLGQPDVARGLIADTAFSADDFKALACVHKDGHRAGQVAHIVSAMQKGRMTAKELRDALSLPSEEQAFDLDLVGALWQRLTDMSADESMWRLFNAATAA